MITTDAEAIILIKKLINFEINDEDDWGDALEELENYIPRTAEILISSKKLPSPEEILKQARELSKPILL